MNGDLLLTIQEWYLRKCDGNWEHDNGVTVESIDNPGWSVSITGESSKLEKRITIERSEADWVHIDASSTAFSAYGGAANLQELLQGAVDWLECAGEFKNGK